MSSPAFHSHGSALHALSITSFCSPDHDAACPLPLVQSMSLLSAWATPGCWSRSGFHVLFCAFALLAFYSLFPLASSPHFSALYLCFAASLIAHSGWSFVMLLLPAPMSMCHRILTRPHGKQASSSQQCVCLYQNGIAFVWPIAIHTVAISSRPVIAVIMEVIIIIVVVVIDITLIET